MRNVAMVSLVSLSFCFAACGDDDASTNTPAAITAETDAGSERGPMVSPLATTIAPPAPPPAAPDAPPPAAEEPPQAPAAGIDLDAGAEDASSQDAAADSGTPIVVVIPIFFGGVHVTEASGASCYFSIDGGAQDTTAKTVLDASLSAGSHQVKCHSTDGRDVTQTVNVQVGTTTNVVLTLPAPPAPGTLVAVAVNGTCNFYVNGVSKLTGAKYQAEVMPGTYSVACYVGGVPVSTRSVIIKSGETAMAMFKLQ